MSAHPKDIKIQDYTYDLPDHRIAQHPLAQRDASKLLVSHSDGSITDAIFRELPSYFGDGDLLVFNETRVIRARLIFPRGEGLRPIEIFCLEPFEIDIESAMSATGSVDFQCMVGNAKKWKDQVLTWNDESGESMLHAEKVERQGGTFIVRFTWKSNLHFAAILEELGKIPLPPYMHRNAEPEDLDRYQTVYATRDGSVAAPTAGLHFTDNVLNGIEQSGGTLGRVILHVGAGTFKPVSADTMEGHDMHSEAIEVTSELLQQLIASPRITSVGTTSCRTLESLYWLGLKAHYGEDIDFNNVYVDQWEPYREVEHIERQAALEALHKAMSESGVTLLRGKTQIIIAPGYEFRVVNRLITNFHQPGSTLILLVAAAIGDNWKAVYNHALSNNYRFLSYGDSSLLHIH